MVDSSSFLVYLVLLVAISNPSCLSCLLVCVEEENKGKRKWGALITGEVSDRGNRDFVKSRNLKP